MSKAISSYPQSERRAVVSRRLDRKSGGLGYWAAMDAQKHQGQVKKVEVAESTPTENLPVLVETLDK
jgi:hypothetical protein